VKKKEGIDPNQHAKDEKRKRSAHRKTNLSEEKKHKQNGNWERIRKKRISFSFGQRLGTEKKNSKGKKRKKGLCRAKGGGGKH